MIVISLGGSVIVPDKPDYIFLKKFKKLIYEASRKNKIVICTGGGKTARDYINALEKEKLSEYVRDLVGIECTRLNAKLLSSFLGDICNKEIPKELEEVADMLKSNKVVVCGGLSVGRTSDGTTAQIANYLNSRFFINVTNVKGLYNKDPNKFKNTRLIKKIRYKELEKMMGRIKERPGQHFIIDSLALELCENEKIKIIIIGKDIKNIERTIKGKKFIGTVVG